ncbi:DDB1- and CUL4-associated factor 17 isoform X2 [Lissotriton helveticus]
MHRKGSSCKQNVCQLISQRSIGCFGKGAGDIHRKNMGILRKLLCQKSTKFQNVWTKHSKSPVAYERGRIYFDNYRCCFNSVAAKPLQLYELAKCSKLEKIEDALLCECPVGELLQSPLDYKSSLIAVTGQNWLLRLCSKTGETLERIYLASYCKFRYLTWDIPQETIVLKSSHKKLTLAQQIVGPQSVLLYLAVFRIMPLSLMGMLEINKECTQQQLDLGQQCNWKGSSGIVGDFPFGVPCNVKITDSPPLLFEVSCLENAFQIGGFPWHYIITPNKKKEKGTYHICSLNNNVLAKNGMQDMQCCSLESDWIYFHPDASGRVIHVGPNQINVLRLKEIQNISHQHQIIEDFVIIANRENKENSHITVTASGRVVKRRFNQLDDDPEQETFKIVDYEDELDLLSVVAVTQTENEGRAEIGFYCNETGALLKSIMLEESWDVTYSHEVYFDRDTVIHIEQKPNRVFYCYVYKMVSNPADDNNLGGE